MPMLTKMLFLAPALAVLGAVLLGAPDAGAQVRQPVDLELSMTNRQASNAEAMFIVSLRNNSDITVRSITVRFRVDDLSLGRSVVVTEGFLFFGDTNDGFLDPETLEWTIPQLASGSTAVTKLELDVFEASATGDSLVRLEGDILESSPEEAQ